MVPFDVVTGRDDMVKKPTKETNSLEVAIKLSSSNPACKYCKCLN